MKGKKFVTAFLVLTAGSFFYGTVPAKAGGVELDRVDITFRRNHDDRYERHAPPRDMPPPHHHHHYEARRRDFGGYGRDFGPRPPHHGPHLPLPPPPHHGPHGPHEPHGPHWHGRRF